ncbi:MAG: peptidylprolyl isomerase [Actinobacteria bacterium]|nr:peptidylprolyl isomerase [Actinomycetota bacterium]
MSAQKNAKNDRVARDRVRAYEARQEVHTRVISRRKRDNIIAAITVAAITLVVVGAQFTRVALFPEGSTSSSAVPTPEPVTQPVPDASISENRTWTGSLLINGVSLGIELDGALAPQAVASTITLAASGFYNDVSCHRLTTSGIFVLQCGDPKGDGTGGPGYVYGPIENSPADNIYPAGTIAMARQGGNAATQGSQFFLVYADSVIPSDAAGGYTVIGRITSGLDSLIANVIDAGVENGATDGRPVVPAKISAFTLQ